MGSGRLLPGGGVGGSKTEPPPAMTSHHHQGHEGPKDLDAWHIGKSPEMFLHQAESFPTSSFKGDPQPISQKGSPHTPAQAEPTLVCPGFIHLMWPVWENQ